MEDTLIHDQIVLLASKPLTVPFVLGTAFTTALFGVTLNQFILYFSTPHPGKYHIHLLVLVSVALEVLQTGFCHVTVWNWFVKQPEVSEISRTIAWPFALLPLVSGLTALLVQTFFASCIMRHNTSYRNLLCILIAFGTVIQLMWATILTSKILKAKEYDQLHTTYYLFKIWKGVAALTDTIIMACMIRILLRINKKSVSKYNFLTDTVNDIFQSNAIPCFIGILDVLLIISRSDASHVTLRLCLSKFSVISLLVCLNSEKIFEYSDDHKITQSRKPIESKETAIDPHSNVHTRSGVHVLTTATVRSHHLNPPQDQNKSFNERFPLVSLVLPASTSTDTSSGVTYKGDGEVSSETLRKDISMMMRPDISNRYTATITGGIHD
ncbi:hypothetical protein DFH28DRAFT_704144 [Melampsora americana]|nr:hypothetical protein DFH28DRAFT_704144 [Melampsora americana]